VYPDTSSLKSKLPELANLDEWMSLILVMLYENQIADSRWKPYFGTNLLELSKLDVLPVEFDTPMFWNERELKQLKGTEVLSRIGKEKSEEQFFQDLLPLLTSNPQLFDAHKCGLEEFHRMGSLVLAYSFGRASPDEEIDHEDDEPVKNDIAMVPLADMLNANPQLNNVLS
jgi:N-lysine methyltransferase SETD6